MSNRPEKFPLGSPVPVGKAGYQLFKEIWPNGDVRFYAEPGRPWKNRKTGAEGIITKAYEGAISDNILALKEAEPQLRALRLAESTRDTKAQPESQPTTLELVPSAEEALQLKQAS